LPLHLKWRKRYWHGGELLSRDTDLSGGGFPALSDVLPSDTSGAREFKVGRLCDSSVHHSAYEFVRVQRRCNAFRHERTCAYELRVAAVAREKQVPGLDEITLGVPKLWRGISDVVMMQ
jgi:hypothetical protein